MSAAVTMPLLSYPRREANDVHALSRVRSQAAFVRTLLDELDRITPVGPSVVLEEQMVEELARLGCRCLEVATSLGALVDEHERVVRGAPPCA